MATSQRASLESWEFVNEGTAEHEWLKPRAAERRTNLPEGSKLSRAITDSLDTSFPQRLRDRHISGEFKRALPFTAATGRYVN